MPVNESEAQKWLQESGPSRVTWLCSLLLFLAHQKIPLIFSHHFTITGFLAGILKLICIISIASSPFWIDYFANNQINWNRTTWLIVALSGCMVYIWFHDLFSRRRKLRRKRRKGALMLAHRQARVFEQLAPLADIDGGAHKAEIAQLIERILNCIDRSAQALLKENDDNYFEVTLITCTKNSNTAYIGWRAHGIRPRGHSVNVSDTIAYYVASAGCTSKALHDLKRSKIYPYEGLSESGPPPYRSILFIPVQDQDNFKGVVTIDASAPYEFWGVRETDLYVTVRPYVKLIYLLLDKSKSVLATTET